MSFLFFSRSTLTGLSSLALFRILNSFSALTSKMNPIPVARIIATSTPSGSIRHDASLPEYAISYPDTPSDSPSATSNMMMIGSLNFSRYAFQRGSFSASGMTFRPFPPTTSAESPYR